MKARSGVYHVLMQGVRHRDIFIDDEDYRTFVEILGKLRVESAKRKEDGEVNYFTIYAYCLMPDHFHLLIKEDADTVSVTMGRIAAAYAHHFNDKYDRDGAIYRARFASEPVEDEGRFNIVLRYICQTPERMKVSEAGEYAWSSWREYSDYAERGCSDPPKEIPRVCEIREEYRKMTKEEMIRMLNAPVPKSACCLGPRTEEMRRPKDDQVLVMLCQMTDVKSMNEFLGLSQAVQRTTLSNLRKKGASVRQLERMTGIGRGVIQNL